VSRTRWLLLVGDADVRVCSVKDGTVRRAAVFEGGRLALVLAEKNNKIQRW
jgi:hypothetical protein